MKTQKLLKTQKTKKQQMNSNKTFSAALKEATERLSKAGVEDAKFDARCLLEKASGKRYSELMFSLTDAIDEKTEKLFRLFVDRRESKEPLQYILGEWDFFGYTFRVFEGVLIPRPETEFLVDAAVKETPHGGVVFDVCSGSGCIGISVAKKRPDVTVYLFEKYDAPFECLSENIQKFRCGNVTAVRCDMTKGVPGGVPRPDVILSNPPYIESDVIPSLQEEVRKEPCEALDGGTDGYDFYRYLSNDWFSSIKTGGIICMECGENMPETVAEIFKQKGAAAAEVYDDIYGIKRFVTVKK